MGPVKAALEATTRYLAAELGDKGIRVFAVSPGPLKTRAASGIAAFDELVEAAVSRAPAHRLVDIAEVGRVVAFLVNKTFAELAVGEEASIKLADGFVSNIWDPNWRQFACSMQLGQAQGVAPVGLDPIPRSLRD
jgi:enoyl-[acyl-carrier-protein] reductase (NADH)